MKRLETTLETRLEKSKDTKGRTAKKATKLFWVASFAAKKNQNLQLNNSSFQDFTIKVTNHNEHNCCFFHKEKSETGCSERERERERERETRNPCHRFLSSRCVSRHRLFLFLSFVFLTVQKTLTSYPFPRFYTSRRFS
jgi:hypothetical protein